MPRWVVDNELSMGWRAPWSGARDYKVFVWAAAGTIIVVAGFVAWTGFRIGGDTVTIAVDDIGEGVAAFVAVACCAVAAKRGGGRQRLGWTLLSTSAFAWGLGEVVWCVYEVGMGVAVPYPSAADIGFLAAIPLAAAGILAFFTASRGTSTRLRLWLDGAIVGLALMFVAWTFGLSAVWADVDRPLEKLANLAYPIGDILIGSILVLAIRRASNEAQGRLLLLLGGLAANSLADSAFSYLNANGTYGAIGSGLDTGWVAGYLLIALATLWPSSSLRHVVEEETIDVWQLGLPWVAVGGAGVLAIWLAATGQTVGPFRTLIFGSMSVLMMVSQVYAHNESRSLLIKARESAATLREIVLYAPLGVVRIGLDMTVIDANPRFAELMQVPASQVVGASLSSSLPPEEMARAAERFRSLSDGSASAIQSETKVLRGDGKTIWLQWSATAVHKSDGTVDYFVAMFNETTARHEAEVAAVANLNVLERLNRLKSEFLTMVSHSFRTALVGIQGFSELMRDSEDLDLETVKASANDIYNDAHRLDELLDRMLDLDALEADKVEFHRVPIDLRAAIAVAVARARASDGRHSISTDLEPDLPWIAADGPRLAQLLGILLDNAVRYSASGGDIVVSGHTERGQVVVGVKDHGIGMPADFDEQLFARYQWSANNPTTKVMGTGLGLPMARQIVEMHGGRIWFESTPGAGSEFHFSVPVESTGPSVPTVQAARVPVAL
jgi:PAS domain S-box-containing protein